jgi:glycosyltransferase involved in cell wall biosynthesis
MAARINHRAPGRVNWEICGSGPDLELLRQRHRELNLGDSVSILGWVSLEQLRDVYQRSHISIVPTRSDFAEGLAMTAAEAILTGRPVITNPVVPALEILRPACIEARTNDVDSYVDAICNLIDDAPRYDSLRRACADLQPQFYDRDQGLAKVLTDVLKEI